MQFSIGIPCCCQSPVDWDMGVGGWGLDWGDGDVGVGATGDMGNK